jgi:hydrogenase-4 component F
VRRAPVSAWLFLLAFLAITGMPPFAPFLSEFNIAAAAFTGGRWVVGAIFLAALGGIFLGMSDTVVQMIFGTPSPTRVRTPYKDTFATTAPLVLALGLALLLGLWMPRSLQTLLQHATQFVEGRP